MRKILAPIAITAAIAGGAGALAFAPGFAGAQDAGTESEAPAAQDTERTGPFEEVIAGLVADGTLTQEQGDKVVAALREARPNGGPRHHRGVKVELSTAAEYL